LLERASDAGFCPYRKSWTVAPELLGVKILCAPGMMHPAIRPTAQERPAIPELFI